MARARCRPVARLPVQPGNSDLCFEWRGPIADAIAHLKRCSVTIEPGPMQRFGAEAQGTSVYFRDPDGSLLEFISYQPDGEVVHRDAPAHRLASRCARTAANTARNISGVSTPVLVL